jgi:hypothetical protein
MGAKEFYEWFLGWYKEVCNEVNVMISVPNEIQPYIQNDVIILDLFKATSDFVITEPYLKQILDKADEFGLTIYFDPEPKYPTKNTKQIFIFWYNQFGFELTENGLFMKRVPKKNQKHEVVI